jgi:DNA-binding beta-propeller fold protein YncE
VRQESDGTVTAISPLFFDNNWLAGSLQFKLAISPTDYWYTISTYSDGIVKVHRFSEFSSPTILPIAFDNKLFENTAYELMYNVSIDIGPDGKLAVIISASGINFQAPFYQRVYRADADGKNLVEVANFDALHRTGGPVDIAVGPDHSIFVLSLQDEGEFIYRIDRHGNITKFVFICLGNDPSSIDVDPNGTLWFSTTNGIYRVLLRDDDNDGMPNEWEELYGLNPLVDDASDDPDNDGFSNIREYRANTDPQNPDSHPSKAMPWIPLLLLDD